MKLLIHFAFGGQSVHNLTPLLGLPQFLLSSEWSEIVLNQYLILGYFAINEVIHSSLSLILSAAPEAIHQKMLHVSCILHTLHSTLNFVAMRIPHHCRFFSDVYASCLQVLACQAACPFSWHLPLIESSQPLCVLKKQSLPFLLITVPRRSFYLHICWYASM